MNKKAFELAISTLILIVLGVFFFLLFVYALTGGFSSFKKATNPFIESESAKAVIQICSDACSNNIKLTYCCQEFDINNEKIKCFDERLEVDCDLNCQDFQC